jgi:hypothetical protein
VVFDLEDLNERLKSLEKNGKIGSAENEDRLSQRPLSRPSHNGSNKASGYSCTTAATAAVRGSVIAVSNRLLKNIIGTWKRLGNPAFHHRELKNIHLR